MGNGTPQATLALAAIIAASVPALAQTQGQIERRYTQTYKDCLEASEGITVEILDCTAAEIKVQDARLNQAYVMVMRPLPKPRKDKLRTLQRAWIKQRDSKCSAAADQERGGSMGGIIFSGCILDQTIERTIWLENYKG